MVVSSYGSLVSPSRPRMAAPLSSSITLFNSLRLSYETLYRTQPEVRKCVDFLGRNIAQLGLHWFHRDTDTARTRLTDHPAALVMRRPNPGTTPFRLIESTIQDLGVYFNAIWLKVRTRPGLGLVRLPPREVQIEGGLFPTAYVWNAPHRRFEFPPSEIIHFSGYDPLNEFQGLSPLETLRRVLAEELAAREHMEYFWRNGARVHGVIEQAAPTLPGRAGLTPQQKQLFAEHWRENFTGGANAGKTAVLDPGMTFKAVTLRARDAELMPARRLTREEVASAYHIPLPMVGILDHATFSNVKEQHKHLYQDCLGPWLVMVEQELERQLLPEFEGPDTIDQVYCEFNITEKLKGSFEEQASAITALVGRPVMTANEGRARLNLSRHDDPSLDQVAPPHNASARAQEASTAADPSEEGRRDA